MAPYPRYQVAGVVHEESLVIRIRAVGWIGKPEILPDNDAIFVASLVEFIISGLAHPIAYHIEVHLLMQSKSLVVVLCPETEIILAETPVTSLRGQSVAIDINLK